MSLQLNVAPHENWTLMRKMQSTNSDLDLGSRGWIHVDRKTPFSAKCLKSRL